MSLFNQVSQQTSQQIADKRTSDVNYITCRIVGVNARNRSLWVQHLDTQDIVQVPCLLPFSEIFRIPTPQSNWVHLLVNNEGHVSGLPILMDRDYREPVVFETSDPSAEGA